MEDDGNYEELKEPIESLAREITQNYVSELTKEATKRAIKNRTKSLDKENIIELENEIRGSSDKENINRFKEASDKIFKDIHGGNIKGDEKIEQISNVLETSHGIRDYEHYEELKKPVENVACEITRTYVREITREATKKAIKVKIGSLKKEQIIELENEIKKKTDKEIFNQFKESSDKILKGIHEGSIKGDKATEQMSNVLKSSLDTGISLSSTETQPLTKARHASKAFFVTPLVILSLSVLILLAISSLSISPGNLNLEAEEYGSCCDHFHVSNAGKGILIWRVYSDQKWISLSPENGINSGTFNVTVNTANLNPGKYQGTVTIESSRGKEQRKVSVLVKNKNGIQYPILVVYPSFLNFNLSKGKSTFGQLQILNEGGGTLQWNVSLDPERDWISLYPTSGTNSGNVTVTVNTEGLEPGEYEGNIAIRSNGENKEATIYLNVTSIKPPILSVEPDPLLLNFNLSEGELASGEFHISNKGWGILEWNVVTGSDWPSRISFNQTSGRNLGNITITVNAKDLSPGEYERNFTVESNGGTKQGTIYLNVLKVDKPILSVDPPSLFFNLSRGESTSGELQISNKGGGILEWNLNLDPDEQWINLYPTSGTNSGNVTVTVNTEGLEPGEYEGNIAMEL